MMRILLFLSVALMATGAVAETGVADSGLFTLNTTSFVPVDEELPLPAVSGLNHCYPNPFNPQTTVVFSVAQNNKVDLAVYDLKGHLVDHLIKGESMVPGVHEETWQGCNQSGESVAGGVYLFRLKVGNSVFNQRVTLVK